MSQTSSGRRTPASRRRSSSQSEERRAKFGMECSFLLKKPSSFFKHVKKKKPHVRFVVCSDDLREIRWARKESLLKSIAVAKSAKVKDLLRITLGWETEVFKKSLQKGRDSCCFSLVFANRTLDLQAKSEEERNKWANAFRWLLNEKSAGNLGRFEKSVSVPFNVVHKTHVNTNFEWRSDIDLEEEFEMGRQLGKGAFGIVCQGFHKSSGMDLAIKKIDLKLNGEKPEDIKAEVAVLKKCRHKNIVSFFGCAGPDKEKKLWILMELCNGGSLQDLLDACGALKEPQIQFVTAKMLSALCYLHQKSIVHRDLKAGNVLVTMDGNIKLTDFGISLSLGGTGTLDRKGKGDAGKFNTIAGSPLWMAPEVILGAGATYLSDVWSFGITLIEMAEKLPPHVNLRSALRVMTTITRSPPPKLKDRVKWTNEFHDFLEKCLKKKPEERLKPSKLVSHPFVARLMFSGETKNSPLTALVKFRLRAKRREKLMKLKSRFKKSSAEEGGSGGSSSTQEASSRISAIDYEESEEEESSDDGACSMIVHEEENEGTTVFQTNFKTVDVKDVGSKGTLNSTKVDSDSKLRQSTDRLLPDDKHSDDLDPNRPTRDRDSAGGILALCSQWPLCTIL